MHMRFTILLRIDPAGPMCPHCPSGLMVADLKNGIKNRLSASSLKLGRKLQPIE